VKKESSRLPGRNAEESSIYTVPAVDRAARILLMLTSGTREMTLAEIAAATGYHKSSVHKILMTLSHHGFLNRNESSKRYSLGIALARCGQAALDNLNVNRSAKSVLKDLSDFSGETANLAVLSGSKMVIVEAVEPLVELRVSPPIGTTDSVINKSNGKAVLAWMPEDLVGTIIKREGLPANTRHSITDAKAYRKELESVRAAGYAMDFEEFQDGISAVSAPIFDDEGHAVATLSIVGPAFRMTKEKMQRFGQKCAKAAAHLRMPGQASGQHFADH
jgi:DNA-binding IclR family transcriptional regulator